MFHVHLGLGTSIILSCAAQGVKQKMIPSLTEDIARGVVLTYMGTQMKSTITASADLLMWIWIALIHQGRAGPPMSRCRCIQTHSWCCVLFMSSGILELHSVSCNMTPWKKRSARCEIHGFMVHRVLVILTV